MKFLGLLVVLCARPLLCQEQVRLAGGKAPGEGRVEIYHDGRWGTVCDDGWDIRDAKVVCRSLGQPNATYAIQGAFFGRGSGKIWLDDVHCRGTESSLSQCSHRSWGFHNCGHGEDASVVCGEPSIVKINITDLSGVITSPGYPQYMRRANYEWTLRPPVPNTLVLISFKEFDLRRHDRGKSKVTIEDSNHVQLFQSENANFGQFAVRMSNSPGTLRFYSSFSRLNGGGKGFRLNYLFIGQGFCKADWNVTVTAGISTVNISWPPPSASSQNDTSYSYLVLYNSTNTGVQSFTKLKNLTSITIDNQFQSDNFSIQVVAFDMRNHSINSCPKIFRKTQAGVRLAGGKAPGEGRVEVYHNGQWGTVCDDAWGFNNAKVVCRSLNLPITDVLSFRLARFGLGVGRIWLDNVGCTGSEPSLYQCRHNGWGVQNCGHSEDASVVCGNPR
ncbi:deleted in malignant brain tumors 1 protein-like, partial [Actinia tenebrosa]|uniref:Deleted in malignant brain tumors 1 protein-like n=1 Tax=Actinia tenebrosa TaxID=6105 RepID=A0A6P8H6L4_ACTTE